MKQYGAGSLGKKHQLFLAYRDSLHERLGRSYCERFGREWSDHEEWSIAEWKFEMLAARTLGELAIAEAERSEVAVISTRAGEALPAEVSHFMGGIDAASPGPCMIVVLLSSELTHGDPCPDYSFLETQSKRLRVPLVVYVSPSEKDFSFGSATRLTLAARHKRPGGAKSVVKATGLREMQP